MTEQPLKIIKEARYDTQENRKCELSIQVSQRGLCAMIIDSANHTLLAFAETVFDDCITHRQYISSIASFLSHDIFAVSFTRVMAIVVNNKSTLVPEALMDSGFTSTFLDFNHTVDENERVAACKVKNGSISFVFAMNADVNDTVRQRFPNAKFYHQAAPLVDAIFISIKNKVARKKIFVSVEHDFFDMIVVSGENLLMHNTFSYQSDTDMVYYLMSVFEQMKMNPQVNEVTFSGLVDYDLPVVTLTKRFVKNVYFVSFKDERDRIGYAFDSLPFHKYTNILNLFKCE